MNAVRKVSLAAVMAAIVLALGAAPAFAWGNRDSASRGMKYQHRSTIAAGYVDADGDGSCDNFASGGARGSRSANFIDEDGDGICDNRGTGTGFVDADGDGVCDNQGIYGRHDGTGNGSGNGHHGGRL